jgi:hypothetical protein
MNLENLNLVELNAREVCEVEGGGRLPRWSTIKKWGGRAWDALGVADAIDEFRDGWNSTDCDCK